MKQKTALDYALDLFSVPLHCPCGKTWRIKSRRVRPFLQTICPRCRAVDQLDEGTALRINHELNEAMEEVARRLGVPHNPIPMPKYRTPRIPLEPEPKGYPVGLAGESFYQPAIRRCFPNERVKLLREPNNPHDPLAITVFSKDGSKIGYIPRDSFLQQLIHDEGGGCSARILKLPTSKIGTGNIGVVLDVVIDGTLIGEINAP